MKVVHIGCGNTIIPNALNIDYIRAFKYIRHPGIANIMYSMGLLEKDGYQLIKKLYPIREFVKWGRATNLPVEDECADVVYSCHMMEHLTHMEAEKFLKEVWRILKRGGTFRLVLPDLHHYIKCYCENHDADEFLKKTYLDTPSLGGGIRSKIRYLVYGNGIDKHSYMYDSSSAGKFLEQIGFRDITVLKAGETTLCKIEGLDLYTRQIDSLYIECRK